jgi:hypothetical protein
VLLCTLIKLSASIKVERCLTSKLTISFQERPYTVMAVTGLLKYNVKIENELTYLRIM